MREFSADIAIIGGGLGGVAAALGALRSGRSVVMTVWHVVIGALTLATTFLVVFLTRRDTVEGSA